MEPGYAFALSTLVVGLVPFVASLARRGAAAGAERAWYERVRPGAARLPWTGLGAAWVALLALWLASGGRAIASGGVGRIAAFAAGAAGLGAWPPAFFRLRSGPASLAAAASTLGSAVAASILAGLALDPVGTVASAAAGALVLCGAGLNADALRRFEAARYEGIVLV